MDTATVELVVIIESIMILCRFSYVINPAIVDCFALIMTLQIVDYCATRVVSQSRGGLHWLFLVQ